MPLLKEEHEPTMLRRSLTTLVCVLVLIPQGWCTCGAALAGCPEPVRQSPQPPHSEPAAGCSGRHAAPGKSHTGPQEGGSSVRVSLDHRGHGNVTVPPPGHGHEDRHSPDCGAVTPKVSNGVNPPNPVVIEPVLANWFAATPTVPEFSLPLLTSPFPARTPVYLALNVLRI